MTGAPANPRRGPVAAADAGAVAGADRFAFDPAQVFFADRERGRAAGAHRSLERARAVLPFLELTPSDLEGAGRSTVTVVGSKGKGTAATCASAVLCAAGLRTGTLTSPGYRTNRERIRVDGQAIGPVAYASLVDQVARAAAAAESGPADAGYLAPTGLFTLAALRHFADSGCDAWVLEAGMGGGHDEVALVPAAVVAVAEIFGEHLGVLGATVGEIAAEKLGVAGPATRAVVALSQPHEEAAPVVAAAPGLQLVRQRDLALRLPDPIRANAELGAAAAVALLALQGSALDEDTITRALMAVRLPGRLSHHARGTQRWVVDGATNAVAAAAALRHCRTTLGKPSAVLVCVPDGKDAAGTFAALQGERVIPVRTDAPHLTFTGQGRELPALRELDVARLGPRVLAIGTVHFVGDVLELLDVDTERSFDVPASAD